jgi:hypothetical protein
MPYGLYNTPADDNYIYGYGMTHMETDDLCDEIDEIEDDDDNYHECIHHKYYIGSYFLMKDEEDKEKYILLFANKIKLQTFYKFTNYEISTYIYLSSGLHFKKNPNIDIIQLIIEPDETYTAIIKTFWIKIIQRTWKKLMKQKKQNDAKIKRQIFSFSNTFQTTTRIHTYKGLKGMLS